jgi:hypothetical protein
MLHLASQEFTGLRVLIVDNDISCISEMATAVERSGGIIAATVSDCLAVISYVKLWKIDAVIIHTVTLGDVPFNFHGVLASLGVTVIPVTSFDDWYEFEERDIGDEPMAPINSDLVA